MASARQQQLALYSKKCPTLRSLVHLIWVLVLSKWWSGDTVTCKNHILLKETKPAAFTNQTNLAWGNPELLYLLTRGRISSLEIRIDYVTRFLKLINQIAFSRVRSLPITLRKLEREIKLLLCWFVLGTPLNIYCKLLHETKSWCKTTI